MVNCNPETVSTDYDTSDRLYFEPLDEEAVLAVLAREQPVGVCIQFGGQTPLKLARAIERAGYRILGTPFDAVDLAEDRERFGRLAAGLGVRCPDWGIASDGAEAAAVAARIGYPVLVRPSYVLGGRAMRVCYDADDVAAAMAAVEGPVLVDRFLESAIELDVDALCDGNATYVAAVMEHVEEAGIHSGDSSCVLPAPSDSAEIRELVRAARAGARRRRPAERPARARRRRGLRARGQPARVAHRAVRLEGDRRQPRRRRLPARRGRQPRRARPAAGGLGVRRSPRQGGGAAVRPLRRAPTRCSGPEMRSTGEVMASGARPRDRVREGRARGGARAARRRARVPERPGRRQGRRRRRSPARSRRSASSWSRRPGRLRRSSSPRSPVERVEKGEAVVELVRSRGVDLVVNTPQGRNARRDGYAIREAAVIARVPCITTLAVARAAVEAIANGRPEEPVSLQERQAELPQREVALRAAS